MDHTEEFTSPDFHDVGAKFFLGAILAAMIVLAASRQRPTLPRLLIVCLGVAWALIAWRNVPLFGLTAVPILALHGDSVWLRLPDARGIRRRFALAAHSSVTAIWIVPVAVGMLLLGLNRGRLGTAQLIEDRFDPATFPVTAVNYAKANRLDGRIFSEFTWNGYLEYAWPAQKIFIDGGVDFFGEDLFREYGTVSHLGAGWRNVLRRWKISDLLIKHESSLARESVRGGEWQVIHCDSLAVLLHRSSLPVPMSPAQADSAEHELSKCSSATRPIDTH